MNKAVEIDYRCWMIYKIKTLYWCDVCNQVIDKPHVYCYAGYPKPMRKHVCLDCAEREGMDPKVKKVAEEYLQRTRKTNSISI